MTKSSSCKHNWSTFTLIHTKVHNKLPYRQLKKLVYIHYNMQIRLSYTELDNKPKELEIDPIDLQYYNEDSQLILEWVEAAKNQEDLLLDKAGDPLRLSRFITMVIEEETYP
ncbi:hypothetical protein BHE74_00058480 [Ensete ventricosum]|nr:hypothetical protein GW17_00052791 [Ensete ventricosum]RWW36499.1 hypothetical protein BHE74_00058480 [Ensete ventricosum]RZS03684.1 hypothetical protein BHM03_00033891 [Ensete ventricosum]